MTNAHFREVEVERLVLREPNGGRARAVLETVLPADGDDTPFTAVRLTLLSPTGLVGLVVEIGHDGAPRLCVGPPDRGVAVVITTDAVDLWRGGNVVAAVRSTDDGGQLELGGADGGPVIALPAGGDG